MHEFKADPDRYEIPDFPETGIPIRAKTPDGKWGNVDLAHLDAESLLAWLQTRPQLAEATVFCLLGHDQQFVYQAKGETDENSPAAWAESVSIFSRYAAAYLPVQAEHDELYVCVDPGRVSPEDKARLGKLGWDSNEAGTFLRHTSA